MNPISNKIANLIAQNKSDDEIYELLKNEGYKDYEISNAVIAHKRSGKSGFRIVVSILVIILFAYMAFDYVNSDVDNVLDESSEVASEQVVESDDLDQVTDSDEGIDSSEDVVAIETASKEQPETTKKTVDESSKLPAQVEQTVKSSVNCIESFYDNLRSCTPSKCVESSTALGDVVLEVKGLKNGRCEYFEDTPFMTMTCMFTPDDRLKMADFQEYYRKNQGWSSGSGVEYFDFSNSPDCTFASGSVDLFGTNKVESTYLEGNPFSSPVLNHGQFIKDVDYYTGDDVWKLPVNVSKVDGAELVLSSSFDFKFEGNGLGGGQGLNKNNNSDRYVDMSGEVSFSTPGAYSLTVNLYDCSKMSDSEKSEFKCGTDKVMSPYSTNVKPFRSFTKYFEFADFNTSPVEITKSEYLGWTYQSNSNNTAASSQVSEVSYSYGNVLVSNNHPMGPSWLFPVNLNLHTAQKVYVRLTKENIKTGMIETENFYVEASDSFDFVVAKSTVGDMRLKLVVHECNMFNDYDYTQSNCHHNLAPVSDHPSFPYNQEFKASILESRKFKFFGSSRYPSQI